MSPTCNNCGSHVTERFARVMGDRENTAHACLNCTDKAKISYAANGRERPYSHE